MKFMLIAAAVAATALAAPLAQADTNVALGAAVNLSGTGFGNSNGWGGASLAAPGSITNGSFLPNGTQWDTGTVFWSGGVPDLSDTITITLNQAATVSSLQVQADNNDVYTVSYENSSNSWQTLTSINAVAGWGLEQRTATFAPVTAKAFQIVATGGDGDYAVAQFQANGTALPVPEPASAAMMLLGVGAMLAFSRRRMLGQRG